MARGSQLVLHPFPQDAIKVEPVAVLSIFRELGAFAGHHAHESRGLLMLTIPCLNWEQIWNWGVGNQVMPSSLTLLLPPPLKDKADRQKHSSERRFFLAFDKTYGKRRRRKSREKASFLTGSSDNNKTPRGAESSWQKMVIESRCFSS